MAIRSQHVLLSMVLLSCFLWGCSSELDRLRENAEKGDINAQASLASDYLKGDGVKRSRQKARFWAEKAARKGHPKALVVMGLSFIQTKPEKRDFAKARQFFETAAKTQYPSAQFNLAVMHERGDGVPKNLERARELYEKAANQGEHRAQANLGRLIVHSGKPDYVVAYKWLQLSADKKKENVDLMTSWVKEKKITEAQLKEVNSQVAAWKVNKVYKPTMLVPKADVDKLFKSLGTSVQAPPAKILKK
jgi:TPR repeat protein